MFPLLPASDRLSCSTDELLPGSFLLRGAMLPLLRSVKRSADKQVLQL